MLWVCILQFEDCSDVLCNYWDFNTMWISYATDNAITNDLTLQNLEDAGPKPQHISVSPASRTAAAALSLDLWSMPPQAHAALDFTLLMVQENQCYNHAQEQPCQLNSDLLSPIAIHVDLTLSDSSIPWKG
jgi:hypothetical protein